MLHGHGPGNGALMVLPLDQGLEHGPTDFFPHPPALDPDYQFRLAVEGHYSAIALGVGLAEKYMGDSCGQVPLILKLNGKTNIPDDEEAVSAAFASVEDAVRLGADAVGYTIYVGSPRQDVELREYRRVRQDCERLGMPLVMWAYPRGRAIDARGGRATLYAQDYAARVAEELGADVVKLHEPTADTADVPEPYRSLKEDAGGAGATCGPLRGAGVRALLRRRKGRPRRAGGRQGAPLPGGGSHRSHVRPQHVVAPVRRGAAADAAGPPDPRPSARRLGRGGLQ